MKKIRCFLATIALLMSLSGISLLPGLAVGSLTTTASSTQHVTTAFHMKPNVPCPGGGTSDC